MSWPTVTLSEVAEINPGKPKNSDFNDDSIVFLPMKKIGTDGRVDFSEIITFSDFDPKSYSHVRQDDIIVAQITPCFENGKISIVDLGPHSNGFATGSAFILRPDRKKILPRYLHHALRDGRFQYLGEKQMRGTTGRRMVPRSFVESYSIHLPPLDEQSRITAILDKADEIKQASDKTEDIREQFANAIFLDIFGDPVLNTKNWDTLPMTEIFEIITGKLDSNAAVEGGEYPFFTCAKEASQIDHFAFDCECLLLAGNNASGDFDVKYYNGKFNAYQRTYILTTDKIEYDYARFALDYQLKKLKQSSLGTNTRYLTMGIFKRMHIQIPSRDLQKQFSLYYNALRNSAEQDEIKISELLKSTESLVLMNH